MADGPIVLIVDDDVDVAEVTCEILSGVGASAIYRTTVADALDALVRHAGTIRVLVTDIHLASPMTGIDLAVHVSQQWPRVGICVTSGIATERPRRIPANAVFLPKPWRAPELIAMLRSCDAEAATRSVGEA